MKILMVSMNSIHFRRWVTQLEDSGHEVYWFDIKDQGYIPSLSWIQQITDWKKGFLKKKGRYFLKRKFPKLYQRLSEKFDVKISIGFAKAVEEIQPDIIHSFALYTTCVPMYEVMKTNTIPWVYSSWGSDLFNKSNKPDYDITVPKILKRVDYLFADCHRDFKIASANGFKGQFLGVFPGGGGYHLEALKKYIQPVEKRNIILVKGYENELGKASVVLNAVRILDLPEKMKVVVYGSTPALQQAFQEEETGFQFLSAIPHKALFELMGASLISIGNSISDGMPNTLLEAICLGAFPIQSNPGGASEDVISSSENGLLIEEPLQEKHIASLIKTALENKEMIHNAFTLNSVKAAKELEYMKIKKRVVKAYNSIQ